jgi:hypothetical protein
MEHKAYECDCSDGEPLEIPDWLKVPEDKNAVTKAGRSPLPETERASEQIQLRVTRAQKEGYKAAARQAGCWDMSEWIKATLDAATSRLRRRNAARIGS